jgi:hypothetical protein
MRPSIAVITPRAAGQLSALLPAELAKTPTEWEWYHRCLSTIARVRYFDAKEWESVSGFSAVLVHEGIETETGGLTVMALSKLRRRNAKLIWVEPHQRSTFAAPVFEPGFFDVVDRIAKYQLMKYEALLNGLRSAENNLAPWAFYGQSSIADFYANATLFALPTSPKTLNQHLSSDLTAQYGERIAPMMRLFTLPRRDSWYNGPPSRQARILKEAEVGIPLGDWPSATIRGMVAGLIGQRGLNVKVHGSRLRAAATSEAFVALGPVHLDGGAADVTRFETLAILPEDERYLIWDDVFIPYETYLPLVGFGGLLSSGGRVINGAAARRISAQLADDLADLALRSRILDGQRKAHAMLMDPEFVAEKLGLESSAAGAPPQTIVPRVRPRAAQPAAPIRIGGVSTDEVSVVIQGALGRGNLAEQVIDAARRHLPGCQIVLSTWEGERELGVPVDQRVECADPGAPWQVHEEWPSNTNRLSVSTRAGLEACTRPYTLKLRSDTPLEGARFLEIFQRYPERGTALRLLRDRIVVINYYCWNPEARPYGLFSIADTVNFGRTEDVRELWSRPLDEEPAIATWFETHARPNPDLCSWAVFRYTPEQLLWLGFLRQHIDVPFEHFCDVGPAAWLLGELSIANNLIIVDPAEFGVELPTFAGREPLEPDALYTHAMWQELYDRYCLSGPQPAVNAVVARLERAAPRQLDLDRANNMALNARTQAIRAQEARSHTAPALPVSPLEGARPFVVLVEAEELLVDDDSLRAYADAMSGAGHVTLAIDASRFPVAMAEQEVRALVDRCHLSHREDIDLLAVLGPHDAVQRSRMLAGAHALYRNSDGHPSDLPVFTPASLDHLRAFAEQRSGAAQTV